MIRQRKSDLFRSLFTILLLIFGLVNYSSVMAGIVANQSKLKEIDVIAMGAVPNNPNIDNSVVINRCIELGDSLKLPVSIPAATFYVKRQIRLMNGLIAGFKGKSRIVFASDFVFDNSVVKNDFICVLNRAYSRKLAMSSMNEIRLRGIIFEMRISSLSNGGEAKLLALANVSGGMIEDCIFKIAPTNLLKGTCIDLYAIVQNLEIKGCEIYNLSKGINGGGMWIRNWGYSLTENYDERCNTQNVTIRDCAFYHAAGDECLAIFGSTGKVKRVNIVNCSFEAAKDGKYRNVFVSVFAMNEQSRPFAAVESVVFDSCTFRDNRFNNQVLRIGLFSKRPLLDNCKDVVLKNCTFAIEFNKPTPKGALICVARNVAMKNSGIEFVNNKIDVSGKSRIGSGVYGFDLVSANTIRGNIGIPYMNCGKAYSNVIKLRNN